MSSKIHVGSHLKKILSKGSWFFLSSIIIKAGGVFILPVITRILTQSEIGVLRILDSINQVMIILISLALDQAYSRFIYANDKSDEQLKRYISTYFWIIVLWGSFVVSISLIIGKIFLTDYLSIRFYPLITLTMIGPLLMQLGVLGRSFLRKKLKTEYISIVTISAYAF